MTSPTATVTGPPPGRPASETPGPGASDPIQTGRRPRWGRWAQLSVAAVAGVLYLSNLSVNGLGNPYYAAAVKSGSVSWKAFLFGSLDPGSFITVDKPPAAFWVQALSVRAFGYSSWSLLVPEAVAGIIAVAVVYHLARRLVLARQTDPSATASGTVGAPALGTVGAAGAEVAGVLAGLALAVTPIAAVMFRFNDPDALLTLLLVLAAWAGWVAVERGSIRHLVLAGFLVGLAFLSKELVAAVVVPGLALAWIVAAPIPWRRRLLGWLWSGLALVVSAGWWVALVQLWPASDRPYIGSSTDNSIISVIFGYNGFSRLFGGHGGGPGRSGGASFGGGASWTRMFADTLGSQISWLIPLAALGLVFGLASSGRAPWRDRRRAGYILWAAWALAAFVVFSKSSGTFHPYYTVALAPPVALLAATGAVDLWAVGRRHRALSWLLPAGVVGSGLWAHALLARDPSYHPWLRTAVVVVAVVAAVGLLVAFLIPPPGRLLAGLGLGAGVLAAVSLLAGPAAWSLSSVSHAGSGDNPTAGPASASTGFGGSSTFGFRPSGATRSRFGAGDGVPGRFGGRFPGGAGGGLASAGTGAPSAGDRKFVSWLEAHRDGARYLVAVDSSMSADDLIIASGKPIMAMGGFSGGDPDPTLAQFEKLVSAGRVRYVLVGGRGGFGGAGFGGAGLGGGGFGSGSSGGQSSATGGRSAGGSPADEGVSGRGTRITAAGAGQGSAGRGSTVTEVEQWAEAHGTEVPTSEWGGGVSGTLYEVTPADVTSS